MSVVLITDEDIAMIKRNILLTREVYSYIRGKNIIPYDDIFDAMNYELATSERPSIKEYTDFKTNQQSLSYSERILEPIQGKINNISLTLNTTISKIHDFINYSQTLTQQFYERLELVSNLFILLCTKDKIQNVNNKTMKKYKNLRNGKITNSTKSLNNTLSPNEMEHLKEIVRIDREEMEIKMIQYYCLCLYNIFVINDFILLDSLDHPGYKRELLKSKSPLHVRNTVRTAFKTPIEKMIDAYVKFGFVNVPESVEKLKEIQDMIRINLEKQRTTQTMNSKFRTLTQKHELEYENIEPMAAEEVVHQGKNVSSDNAERLGRINNQLIKLVKLFSYSRENYVIFKVIANLKIDITKISVDTESISQIDSELLNELEHLRREIETLPPNEKEVIMAISNLFHEMCLISVHTSRPVGVSKRTETKYAKSMPKHKLTSEAATAYIQRSIFDNELNEFNEVDENNLIDNRPITIVRNIYVWSKDKTRRFNTKSVSESVSIQRQYTICLLMMYIINPFILLNALDKQTFLRTFIGKRSPPKKVMDNYKKKGFVNINKTYETLLKIIKNINYVPYHNTNTTSIIQNRIPH